jgi:YegS/Rv2252/BmrU family lipid kinase
LIYNPVAGKHEGRRIAQVEGAAEVLRGSGVQVSVAASKGPQLGGEQAQQMVASGCDTVFACGGDGTVNDVLQGLVGTQAALGIIPLGTANALAHDLRIPRRAVSAAQSALNAERKRIAVGKVEFGASSGETGTRYFTVALGVGMDADMFYHLQSNLKQRMGMNAYYAEALHLWMTKHPSRFEVQFQDSVNGQTRREQVSQVLAVRISQFGGVLRRLAPDAALRRPDFQLILFKTSSRTAYLLYVLRSLLDGSWSVPGVELAHSARLECHLSNRGNNGHDSPRIYAEADGEVLGTLPVSVSIVPDALTILVPQTLATEKVRSTLMVAPPPVSNPVS